MCRYTAKHTVMRNTTISNYIMQLRSISPVIYIYIYIYIFFFWTGFNSIKNNLVGNLFFSFDFSSTFQGKLTVHIWVVEKNFAVIFLSNHS